MQYLVPRRHSAIARDVTVVGGETLNPDEPESEYDWLGHQNYLQFTPCISIYFLLTMAGY